MTELPRIDVVIAARNEAAHIGECLSALARQTYQRELTRIVVVDNGSTDDTPTIARELGAVVLASDTVGAGAARNSGIRAGDSELIAFLDAHSVCSENWLRRMAERFDDSRVGGCQAAIRNTACDARVESYLRESGATDNSSVLSDTVFADNGIYPWILSGNCMMRRSAIEYAGMFDESLPSCEDVDLSWRIVLSGYLLDHSTQAEATHINSDTWDAFAAKSARQGEGAAVLADRYLPHGASAALTPQAVETANPDRAFIAREYERGYACGEQRLRSAGRATFRIDLPSTRDDLRQPFEWRQDETIRVSTDAVYWSRGEERSIIVHIPSRSRIVLDDSANFIWRRLALGHNRVAIAAAVADWFHLTVEETSRDLDGFVAELLAIGVLQLA